MERLIEALIVTSFVVATLFIAGLSLEFAVKTIWKFMKS
jgi:hypothetical protein